MADKIQALIIKGIQENYHRKVQQLKMELGQYDHDCRTYEGQGCNWCVSLEDMTLVELQEAKRNLDEGNWNDFYPTPQALDQAEKLAGTFPLTNQPKKGVYGQCKHKRAYFGFSHTDYLGFCLDCRQEIGI